VISTRRRQLFRRAGATLAASTALSLVFGGVALADNIQDSIVDSGSVSLVAGSSTGGTATIRVVGNGSDGSGANDQGCNWDTGEAPLVLNVAAPTGITATPSSLSITACGVDHTVTFQAGASAVNGTATVSIASAPKADNGTLNNVAGYNNQVSIPITITQPNTAPEVSVTGISATEYVIGSEPTPGCSVTDAEQPTATATPTVDRSALVNGLGTVTVTCSFTDNGQLSDTDMASYEVVPPPNTKPTVAVSGVVDGASYEIGSVPAAGCDVTDAEDGSSSTSAVVTGTLSHGLGTQTATCDATDSGGLSADTTTATYTIVDTGDPTITGAVAPTGPDGSNGWYKSLPTVTFTCADTGGSGIDTCLVDGGVTASTTLGEGADQSVSGTATDWAGNTATATVSNIDVDMTNPGATFDSTIGTVYFGSVPAVPVCTATDSLSGPDGCSVSGYSTAVGSHTLTATATDKAGRTGTATLTYTVLAWQLKGFYSPVDLGGVWNTVKGGSTVPLKFEAFAGSELTSTSAITSFATKSVTCPGASAPADEIEFVTTGGTSLRYDATGGQFIQSWATPKKPGTCHTVTLTMQDGSKTSANFMLK
jgi:hypothetical protein